MHNNLKETHAHPFCNREGNTSLELWGDLNTITPRLSKIDTTCYLYGWCSPPPVYFYGKSMIRGAVSNNGFALRWCQWSLQELSTFKPILYVHTHTNFYSWKGPLALKQ